MPTRKLPFSPDLKVQLVPSATSEEAVTIEVPAGEQHFHIDSPGSYEFNLRFPDSKLLVTGLFAAKNHDTPELTTTVIHHVPGTQAETVIRTLSYDEAMPHYRGLIKIEPKAHKSESYLSHYSLLLGPKAKSWTLPSLEILADDVKCSHAATVKTITDLDLFYLRSRGLGYDEAKEMLIQAFTSDVKP